MMDRKNAEDSRAGGQLTGTKADTTGPATDFSGRRGNACRESEAMEA
jgi:hypothetical protein